MEEIAKEISDVSVLLALEPEELASRMLFHYRKRRGRSISFQGIESELWPMHPGLGQPKYPFDKKEAVNLAFSEAWAWLVAQGLLVPDLSPEGRRYDGHLLSRRAQKMETQKDFADYRIARLLPKEVLHRDIADTVWGAFMRGEYDSAAFHAMKAVEVMVREAAELGHGKIGTDLMQEAFAPEKGPLTDTNSEKGEQLARMRLFAGAIGSYKNPHSHRDVNLDDPSGSAGSCLLRQSSPANCRCAGNRQEGGYVVNEIVTLREPRALVGLATKLPKLFLPDEKTAERFFGFFTANIRNKNTRRAYYKAACRFADWCEGRGLAGLAAVKPHYVAAYIEELQGELAKPSVKQHLAALRMLFDWLVVGHAMESNPAHAVRGPRYSQKKGKTPVLEREEARALLAGIDTSTLTGLRDRALIGTMIYTFARVGAVLQMNVADYFTQGRRGWVRLHEKGGKEHEAPCHHKLETYLDSYIAAAGIAGDKDGPLWRTTGRATGKQHRMTQPDAYRMIERRARQTGIKTKIGNHSLRATGITDYLKAEGASLSEARKMANHADTRTTQLYYRRGDAASLDEYQRVGIQNLQPLACGKDDSKSAT